MEYFGESFFVDVREKMFRLLVITGGIANLCGFICNIFLYGMTGPSVVCGLCFLTIVLLGIIGCTGGRADLAGAGIVLIISWFEFPFLYYVYGSTILPYFVMAMVAVAVFLPRRHLWFYFAAILLIDSTVVLVCRERVYGIVTRGADSLALAILCSLVIASFSVFCVLKALIERYESQKTDILEMGKKLEQAANHDGLTGLYNRRYLIRYLTELIRHTEKEFLISLIDIDDFKHLNDTYGHAYGDQVLTELAGFMQEEIEGKGIASRFGGEEFLLVFEDGDVSGAFESLCRIQERLKAFGQESKEQEITFSGGVESYREEMPLDKLFTAVDEKLYQAKNSGKKQIIG